MSCSRYANDVRWIEQDVPSTEPMKSLQVFPPCSWHGSSLAFRKSLMDLQCSQEPTHFSVLAYPPFAPWGSAQALSPFSLGPGFHTPPPPSLSHPTKAVFAYHTTPRIISPPISPRPSLHNWIMHQKKRSSHGGNNYTYFQEAYKYLRMKDIQCRIFILLKYSYPRGMNIMIGWQCLV